MKERPILFSGAMVRALLDGSKTQTRRVMKPQPMRVDDSTILQWRGGLFQPERLPKNSNMLAHCPYGTPGDRLWVRETWAYHPDFPDLARRAIFRADPECEHDAERWRPSIHMPRWACRIELEITGVRVERLQDISEADARAEGCPFTWDGKQYEPPPPEKDSWQGYGRASFSLLWSRINGNESWDANPWVWAIEFRRVS